MNKLLSPLSRILLALIFVISGFGKLTNMDGTAAMMIQNGFPSSTVKIFMIGAIIVELGCGLALLVGFKTRWASLGLIIFLIPTTLIFHVANLTGAQAQMQSVEVLKNLAIMGGLVKFFLDGAGAVAVDTLAHHHRIAMPVASR